MQRSQKTALTLALATSVVANFGLIYLLWRHRRQLGSLAGLMGATPSQFVFLPMVFPLAVYFVARAGWMVAELTQRAPLRRPRAVALVASQGRWIAIGAVVSIALATLYFAGREANSHALYLLERPYAAAAGHAARTLFVDRGHAERVARLLPEVVASEPRQRLEEAQRLALDLDQGRLDSFTLDQAARYLAIAYQAPRSATEERLPIDPWARFFESLSVALACFVGWLLIGYVLLLTLYRLRGLRPKRAFKGVFNSAALAASMFGAWLGLRFFSLREIELFLLHRHHPDRAFLWQVAAILMVLGGLLAILSVGWLRPPERPAWRYALSRLLPLAVPGIVVSILALRWPGVIREGVGSVAGWGQLLPAALLLALIAGLLTFSQPFVVRWRDCDFPVLRHRLFVSYSHRDTAWCLLMKNFLASRSRTQEEELAIWNDQEIRSASDFRQAIARAVDESQAALLLVSPSFLNSEFIQRSELPLLRSARQQEGEDFKIFWLKLEDCEIDEPLIEQVQALYDPSRPLDKLPIETLENALARAADEIAAGLV